MKNPTVCLTAVALIAAASQASAQVPAAGAQPSAAQMNPIIQAAVAAQAKPTGPMINGLCVLSSEAVMANSTVGKYAAQRLQQIETEANAELTTARTTAQNDMRTLDSQRATLGDQAYGAQATALNQRFETLVNTRVREVQATGQAAETRIKTEMTPVIIDSFNAKKCSLLVDATAVILRADAMDITQDVTTRLNAKFTQFPLERLTAQAPAPAPAAAGAPITTTPAAPARPQGPTR